MTVTVMMAVVAVMGRVATNAIVQVLLVFVAGVRVEDGPLGVSKERRQLVAIAHHVATATATHSAGAAVVMWMMMVMVAVSIAAAASVQQAQANAGE